MQNSMNTSKIAVLALPKKKTMFFHVSRKQTTKGKDSRQKSDFYQVKHELVLIGNAEVKDGNSYVSYLWYLWYLFLV